MVPHISGDLCSSETESVICTVSPARMVPYITGGFIAGVVYCTLHCSSHLDQGTSLLNQGRPFVRHTTAQPSHLLTQRRKDAGTFAMQSVAQLAACMRIWPQQCSIMMQVCTVTETASLVTH